MISSKVQSMFDFIDFLKGLEDRLVKLLPVCAELDEIEDARDKLNPDKNYRDKLLFDSHTSQRNLLFDELLNNVYKPISEKLLELELWSGDKSYSSIWNVNFPAIVDMRQHFTLDDAKLIIEYKNKYLDFRMRANSNFYCVGMLFHDVDQLFKELFDFFKDSEVNEFEGLEPTVMNFEDFEQALELIRNKKKRNIVFKLPNDYLIKSDDKQIFYPTVNIQNEFIMRDKITIGNIDNSGQLAVGTNITQKTNQGQLNEAISNLENLINSENLMDEDSNYLFAKKITTLKNELVSQSPKTVVLISILGGIKSILDGFIFSKDVFDCYEMIVSYINAM